MPDDLRKRSTPLRVGIDIGQSYDPTAIAVVEWVESEGGGDGRFEVRQIDRLRLGTPYNEVAEIVKGAVIKMRQRNPNVVVYVDATGVGVPVVELLTGNLRELALVKPVEFVAGDDYKPVTKASGDRYWRCGKAHLASRLKALITQGKVVSAPTKQFKELQQELLTFEVKAVGPRDFYEAKRGAHDDLVVCLAGETMVTTINGEVPIKDVQSGMLVLTRQGWRPVLAAAQTSSCIQRVEVLTTIGRLVGTASHPVWVDGKGFVQMGRLKPGDKLCECESTYVRGSWSSSTGFGSTATRNRDNGLIGPTTRLALRIGRTGFKPFSKRFGRLLTDPSQVVVRSIMQTMMPRTIRLRIWSALTAVPMLLITLASGPGRQSIWRTWLRFDQPHMQLAVPRAKPRRGDKACLSADGPVGVTESPNRAFASTAESFTPAGDRRRGCSALDGAGRPQSVAVGAISSVESASSVVRPSSRTATEQPRPAPVHVLGVYSAAPGAVYNLEVAETPEFFANGILVHNCLGLAVLEEAPTDPSDLFDINALLSTYGELAALNPELAYAQGEQPDVADDQRVKSTQLPGEFLSGGSISGWRW